ncbi:MULTISPECIES: flagellar motor protein [Acidithiobacillus]|jgi:chemotaxis protein MotA|uniref:Flagellar motor rotation protein MotA n=3 Tax=Acidithiobacillus caldus TaxID=33059 RepID=F9ZNA7_ACICS|nr:MULTISPECIES: flagellar motor protein [Acidithiobacillus]AEK58150.1 Flagellar motor rotation protein MotA [Acidithiobacillus caldus SM-1]AIA55138.1 Flagellar motor rotation protein MotA [Acidithiobacillus caldus ATCC 51756]AUW32791.1 flagellar motor protein [Acidithiobacillus caldus]MBU2730615.1 flagellar motor protein [Acidithiobacillus caldus]MBU2734315.1 flagellar motor protein [Acidithiobacillus caldus ATCC 51756]
MDILTLLGLLVALGGILLGQFLEGGKIASVLQLTAFVIVIGGTTGAVMVQYTLPVFLRSVKMLPWIIKPPRSDPQPIIAEIIEWSTLARKNGLLALEGLIDGITDPFLQKGLQMLVDGTEPHKIRDTLEVDLEARDSMERQAAKVFESAGGYAPTIGILGAVLGLIHVMENLADPAKLGAGIATAFVATIYGVGSANLFFLPVSNKIKGIVHQQSHLREMIIEGLVAIAEGENPKIIEGRLQSFFVR